MIACLLPVRAVSFVCVLAVTKPVDQLDIQLNESQPIEASNEASMAQPLDHLNQPIGQPLGHLNEPIGQPLGHLNEPIGQPLDHLNQPIGQSDVNG